MPVKTIVLVGLLGFSWMLHLHGQEDVEQKLKEWESQIQKTPNDPMPYYRKAQCLMKLTKYEDGYQTAKQAMTLFIKSKNELAWIMLENIDLEKVRVDVHFNMGPKERTPPEIGIVKPLSFRIWSKGENVNLIEIIDFEIGMFEGKPDTAALGMEKTGQHVNFGVLKADATYVEIRDKLIALVKARHAEPK